jgi:predicted transcriptional regulator
MNQSLKILREEKGLTQSEFAERHQMSTRSYQRYEAGKRIPNLFDSIYTFAKEAGKTTINELERMFDPPSVGAEGGETKRA